MSDAPLATTHRAALGERALFPNLSARAYLNHAAISPPSTALREQASAFLDDYAMGGVQGFLRWLPQKARLKEKLASLIGADAKDLAFVANTTAGVSNIALTFPWKPGDTIFYYEGDFPANVTPWQQAALAHGAETQALPIEPFHRSAEEGLSALKTALESGARMVVTSFVRFQSGLRMPIEDMAHLCHEAGAELFVDAIQGIGAVPFDVGSVDYVACGAHKWLMGLEGLGFLYVAPGRVAALTDRVAGWLSHEDALSFLFEGDGHLRHDRPIRKEANRFELGAANGIGCAALEASVDLIAQLGPCAIFEHVQAYHDALEGALVELGFASERHRSAELRSASLCLRPPAGFEVSALSAALGTRGVAVTTPDGRLRFAPHWPNSLDEVPFVLEALGAVL
ncbi:MAG: aminotransferase class V-fold PLP-dependent enzyme [Polyangiales bacterium]